MQRDAGLGQPAAHLGVSRQRAGLVVVVGVDRLHAELHGQRRQQRLHIAVANDQPDPRHAVRQAQAAQLRVEIDQTVADELDPPVCARQAVQDRAVEDESAPDLARGLQRVAKGGMVVGAQVTAEPDQCAGQGRVVIVLHLASVPDH